MFISVQRSDSSLRPERFELPTFWFVGGIFALQETTPAYKSQRNQQKQSRAFGWFRLALYPVHGQLHGQFAQYSGYSVSITAQP